MDVKCAKCSEPWDAYGAAHGDMTAWEWDLFKRGAGCPCCEGAVPYGVDEDAARAAHVHAVVIDAAWDDPHAFALVNDIDAPVPAWKKPQDEVIRKCESCGDRARIMKSVDDGELYWTGTTYTQLHHHGIEWDDAIKTPEGTTLNGKFYCPSCVEQCGDCGELNFADDLHLPEGKYRKGDVVCEECLHSYGDNDGDEEDDENAEGEAEEADEEDEA